MRAIIVDFCCSLFSHQIYREIQRSDLNHIYPVVNHITSKLSHAAVEASGRARPTCPGKHIYTVVNHITSKLNHKLITPVTKPIGQPGWRPCRGPVAGPDLLAADSEPPACSGPVGGPSLSELGRGPCRCAASDWQIILVVYVCKSLNSSSMLSQLSQDT